MFRVPHSALRVSECCVVASGVVVPRSAFRRFRVSSELVFIVPRSALRIPRSGGPHSFSRDGVESVPTWLGSGAVRTPRPTWPCWTGAAQRPPIMGTLKVEGQRVEGRRLSVESWRVDGARPLRAVHRLAPWLCASVAPWFSLMLCVPKSVVRPPTSDLCRSVVLTPVSCPRCPKSDYEWPKRG